MTRATANDPATAPVRGRRHRARVRAALAGLLALTLGGASVCAASPAYAEAGHVIRGTVPTDYGPAGAGAVITVDCYGTPGESVSAPAQADGTWQLEVLSPVGTDCAFTVVASPLGGTYRFISSFAVGVTDMVVAVEYPPVTTLDVVVSPGASEPTGTASTSSEGSFTFADGTAGYLTTSLSWDPTQGPASYARANLTFFRFDVPLADGYHVKDPRYASSAPGSLTITVPRTRLMTASGDVVDAAVTTTGRVVLRCGSDHGTGLLGTSYTVSVIAVVDSPCSLFVQAYDGDSETIGERPVDFSEGVAAAYVAVPPLRTITVLEASGAPATGAVLTWGAEASVDLPDGYVQSMETNGRARLAGAAVSVPVPDQDGGVQFVVSFDDGSQYMTGRLAVNEVSSLTITLPPRVTNIVTASVRDSAGTSGMASLNCAGTVGSAAVQPDGDVTVTAVSFGATGCLLSVDLDSSGSSSSYSIMRALTGAPVSSGVASWDVELALPDPVDLHAVTSLGAPVDLTGSIGGSTNAAVMPDGGIAWVSVQHRGVQFAGGLVTLRLPTPANGYHALTDNGSYSSSGPFDLSATSEATFVASGPPGRWVSAGPTTSTDSDGVPDAVEVGAPNDGDGNADGLQDSRQPEVTSLPGADGSYLTLQSAAGTSFGPVSTQDGSALPAPPVGVTLPAGLVSFRVDGLAPGATTTVRIYASSLAGVTGWAKYHDGAWVTLPAGDVSVDVPGGSVEISLTDGGPFDDDGAANGSILDPGGPAVVSDGVAPTVSCAAAPSAWSATNVSIACTAADGLSGLADPADAAFTLSTSVVAGDETGSAATSTREVCDAVGNCATAGPVTGIKVDRRGPAITITSPADGAQITQGAAPAAAYTCTDAGSGQGSCSGTVAAGQPVPTLTPGTATFLVTATDAVGNVSTRSVSYLVRSANTAPAVSADMGVSGLEEIGTQSGALQLTARFTDSEGNGPFTASVQWAPGTAFRTATVTGSSVSATLAYTSSGARAVVVKVCDALGACGTDTVSVRTFVRDRVTPVAECVVDRGRTLAPRYLARFGYSSRASVPLWIPVLPGIENTFLREPARRGQPTVFLPGARRSVLDVSFAQGDVGWRVNGSTATASSKTRRC